MNEEVTLNSAETNERAEDVAREVTCLVRDLTAEVLLRRPADVYTCCADYIERRLRLRDATSAEHTERLSKEKEVAKMRMQYLHTIDSGSSLTPLDPPITEKKRRSRKRTETQNPESPATGTLARTTDNADRDEVKTVNQRKFSNGSATVPFMPRKWPHCQQKYDDDCSKNCDDLLSSDYELDSMLEQAKDADSNLVDDAVQSNRPSSSSSLHSHDNDWPTYGGSFSNKDCDRPASGLCLLNEIADRPGSGSHPRRRESWDRIKQTNVTCDKVFGQRVSDTDSDKSKENNCSSGDRNRTGILTDGDDGYESHSSTLCLDSEEVTHPQTNANAAFTLQSSRDCLRHFSGHQDIVTQCCIFDHYLISSSLDGRLCIWNTLTATKLDQFNCGKPVFDFVCVICPNTDVITLACTEMGKIVLWKVRERDELVNKCIGEYSGHLPNPIRAIASSPDGRYLATGCCFLMNQIHAYRPPQEAIRGTLKLWDLSQFVEDAGKPAGHHTDRPPLEMRTMQQLTTRTLQRRASYSRLIANTQIERKLWGIRALAFSPDSEKLVVGFGHPQDAGHSDINMVAVCCARTLDTLWTNSKTHSQVNSLSFATDSPEESADFVNWELVVGTQGAICRNSLVCIGEKKVDMISHWSAPLSSLDHAGAICPPLGEYIVSAQGGDIIFWDKHGGRKLHCIQAHPEPITKLALSPEGAYLCSASRDKTLKLWRVPDEIRRRRAKPKWKLTAKNVARISLAFTPPVNRKKTVIS